MTMGVFRGWRLAEWVTEVSGPGNCNQLHMANPPHSTPIVADGLPSAVWRGDKSSGAASVFGWQGLLCADLPTFGLTWLQAGMQRFESFTAPNAMVFERQLTEFSCRSSGRGFMQAADRARPQPDGGFSAPIRPFLLLDAPNRSFSRVIRQFQVGGRLCPSFCHSATSAFSIPGT
jgi:hypothetical protein